MSSGMHIRFEVVSREVKFVIVTGVVLGHLLDCIKADTRVPAAEQKSELISAIHV